MVIFNFYEYVIFGHANTRAERVRFAACERLSCFFSFLG